MDSVTQSRFLTQRRERFRNGGNIKKGRIDETALLYRKALLGTARGSEQDRIGEPTYTVSQIHLENNRGKPEG